MNSSTRIVKERVARSAIAEFFKVVQAWHLQDSEARQLLDVPRGEFSLLKRGEKQTLGSDKVARITLLVAIYKGLNILYSRPQADQWVRLRNSNLMFNGDSPLKYMINGGADALVNVQQLLGIWSGYSPMQR